MMAQNDQKLTPNLYYQAFEYSGLSQDIPNSYDGVYVVGTSMSKHHSPTLRLLGSFRACNWPKTVQLLEIDAQNCSIRLLGTLVSSSIPKLL